MVLTVLLIFIIIIVVAQILHTKHNSDKALLLTLIVGFIIIVFYNQNSSYAYNTKGGAKQDTEHTDVDHHNYPKYADDLPIHNQYPIDYLKYNPDGWDYVMDGLPDRSTNNYDIDGHLINGNTVKGPTYTDDFWLQQQNPYGDDAYTSANLHFSRKPKEAFNFQSRWGISSLRPWIAQELDDHANRIWYEDNPDLDQYM